jgi:hypothetical protein
LEERTRQSEEEENICQSEEEDSRRVYIGVSQYCE